MGQFFTGIQTQVSRYLSLDTASFLGVTAFLLWCLFILILIIRLIAALVKKCRKPKLNILFKVEDVTLESFRKKSFVTFDVYLQNTGRTPIEIKRVGFVMADGSEKTFYEEQHVIKTPDRSALAPGEEAFYNDCDLFYCLGERPPYYKKITGLFADVTGYPRCVQSADIPAVMNDQAIRVVLTDKKGVNGF